MTDVQLAKILQHGEIQQRSEYEVVFVFEGHQVYVSKDLETIITVTSPDLPLSNPKTLSKERGEKIKSQIKEEIESIIEDSPEELTFEEYMKNWKE